MSTVLPDISDALADAVAVAADGLVRVEGRQRLPATGVVRDADSLIVTAHHILEHDENINNGFQDGEYVTAELSGRDPDHRPCRPSNAETGHCCSLLSRAGEPAGGASGLGFGAAWGQRRSHYGNRLSIGQRLAHAFWRAHRPVRSKGHCDVSWLFRRTGGGLLRPPDWNEHHDG